VSLISWFVELPYGNPENREPSPQPVSARAGKSGRGFCLANSEVRL